MTARDQTDMLSGCIGGRIIFDCDGGVNCSSRVPIDSRRHDWRRRFRCAYWPKNRKRFSGVFRIRSTALPRTALLYVVDVIQSSGNKNAALRFGLCRVCVIVERE